MKIKSYAKINLALDVLKKSGRYHKISTVFQQIGLFDELTFTKIPGKKIVITCSNPAVPTGPNNTVHKAARILKKYAGGTVASRGSSARKHLQKNICGIHIHIQKNIPVSAGLGGGSSNGAATLVALNKLWHLQIPQKKVRDLAARVGMDAPFFINGGTAHSTHFGEKITPLPDFKLPPMLIALTGQKTATKNIYSLLNLKQTGGKINLTATLIKALKSGKRLNAGRSLNARNLFHNDFETLLSHRKMDKTRALFGLLLKTGADTVGLCGSGPAIYALYKDRTALKNACSTLRKQMLFIWKSA